MVLGILNIILVTVNLKKFLCDVGTLDAICFCQVRLASKLMLKEFEEVILIRAREPIGAKVSP